MPCFRRRPLFLVFVAAVRLTIPTEAVADRAGTVREFRLVPEVLDGVFRERGQQRLLTAAQRYLQEGDTSSAFEAFQELLRQPQDSAAPSVDGTTTTGVRQSIQQLLRGLSPADFRRWDQFCAGPATKALQLAVRKRSLLEVQQVVRRYPYTSAAAQALLIEYHWRQARGQVNRQRVILQQLIDWKSSGVLTRLQRFALPNWAQQLPQDAHLGNAVEDPLAQMLLATQPDWTWKLSPWDIPGSATDLSDNSVGPQFEQRFGAQPPALLDDIIVLKSPAGLTCLDRASGEHRWFLPLHSGSRDSRSGFAPFDRVLEVTSHSHQRMEVRNKTIWVLDGQRRPPVQSRSTFRRQPVAVPDASRIVAVQASSSPSVLWWVEAQPSGDDDFPAISVHRSGNSEYVFRSDAASGVPTSYSDPNEHLLSGNPGHSFCCAPVVAGSRLYVTSLHRGLASLVCLSAMKGDVIWQQPLTWKSDAADLHYDTAVIGDVVDGTVICLFDSGLIAGCSADDGSLLWLQSCLVTDAAETTANPVAGRNAGFQRVQQAQETGSLWIQVVEDAVVCGRRGSPAMVCLELDSGQPRWVRSAAADIGVITGQSDLGCLGVVDDRLLLYGYSHCRAVQLASGDSVWARSTGVHHGRLHLDGLILRVGNSAGRMLTIDARDGRLISAWAAPTDSMGPQLAIDRRGLVDATAWRATSRSWTNPPPELPSGAPVPSAEIEPPDEADLVLIDPPSVGDVPQQLKLAGTLLHDGTRERAELLLLNIKAEAVADRRERDRLLQQVREGIAAPGRLPVEAVPVAGMELEELPASPTSYRLTRFVREHQVVRGATINPLGWYRHNIGTNRLDDSFSLLDLGHAHEIASIPNQSYGFAAIQTQSPGPDAPGLLLIRRKNEIGMLSLFQDDPLQPIWWSRLPDAAEGLVHCLTSRRLVSVWTDGIEARHPLTGQILWQRRWAADESTWHLGGQYFRVHDTPDHVILVSTMGTGCVVLNAGDGSPLKEDAFPACRLSQIIGQSVLLTSPDNTLHALDLITREEKTFPLTDVQDLRPAQEAGSDVAVVLHGDAAISLVDVLSGDVHLTENLKLQPGTRRHQRLSSKLFRRCGLLFLVVSRRDWRMGANVPFGQPQTGNGQILCVDPNDWKVLWKRPTRAEVIPQIYGDPCPLLVLWGNQSFGFRIQLGAARQRPAAAKAIGLTLINPFTGRELLRTYRRATGEPLMLSHSREAQHVDITTTNTVLRVHYRTTER